jgi:hypothetical protein
MASQFGALTEEAEPQKSWGPSNTSTPGTDRILLTEWAYVQLLSSNRLRKCCRDRFLHRYNTRRGHTALGRRRPISWLAA